MITWRVRAHNCAIPPRNRACRTNPHKSGTRRSPALALARLPDGHAQIRPILARSELRSRDERTHPIESIVLSHSYSPFGMIIRRQPSCRPRTRMRSAIGLHHIYGQAGVADSAWLLSGRLARVGVRRSCSSLPPSAWVSLLNAPRGTGGLGLVRGLHTSYEQDFSTAGRG